MIFFDKIGEGLLTSLIFLTEKKVGYNLLIYKTKKLEKEKKIYDLKREKEKKRHNYK